MNEHVSRLIRDKVAAALAQIQRLRVVFLKLSTLSQVNQERDAKSENQAGVNHNRGSTMTLSKCFTNGHGTSESRGRHKVLRLLAVWAVVQGVA